MGEWLIERGIGEDRAALVDNGEILEARILLNGVRPAGSLVAARLANVGTNGRNAIAIDDERIEYLLPEGAPKVTEGAIVTIEIRREAIPGHEPWKRPLARVSNELPRASGAFEEGARETGFPNSKDLLTAAGWDDLLEEARTGVVSFAGGELRISPTPAMTLIDVDGYLEPEELAVIGASVAARAVRRLDIGGSIGVDLPTCSSKAVRQRSALAIDAMLPQPFERTAVNGFGFAQIVRPRRRASLVELALDRAAFEARALLRRAALEKPGPKMLVANPAVIRALEGCPDWLDTLARQVGGGIALRADPFLTMSGSYAEGR